MRKFSGDSTNKSRLDPELFLKDKDIQKFASLLSSIKQKHGLSTQDILKIVEEKILIPVCIFDNEELSPFETIVKFLVENKAQKYSVIAKTLNRDDRTIWATYNKSHTKLPKPFVLRDCDSIPLEVFSNREFSVSENLVGYLKETLGYKNSTIAKLLHRNDRTVWTVYSRLVKKREVVT